MTELSELEEIDLTPTASNSSSIRDLTPRSLWKKQPSEPTILDRLKAPASSRSSYLFPEVFTGNTQHLAFLR